MTNNINNEAFLTDVSGTIAAGLPIYLRATNVSYGFNNIISTNPKVFQDTTLAFNTRKSNISYVGFDTPAITIQGLIDTSNTTGSLDDDSNKQIMTVGRLWEIAKSAKTFYLYDSRIIEGIVNAIDGAVEEVYTSGSIPVVVSNISMSTSSDNINEVTYSIELLEDREVS